MNAAGFPFTWASNYGGRVQYNSMPEYVSANMAYRLQSRWLNQGNMFGGCSGFMPMMPQMQMQQSADASTVQGYIDGRKTRISVISNQSSQNLAAGKAELQALINDPSTTEAQKKEINKFLTRITQIETELQKAVQNAQMANNPQILDEINNQVEALAGISQELLSMIPEMLKLLIQEAEQVTETEQEGETQPGDNIQVIAPEGSNPEESLVTTTNKQVSPQVRAITENIYTAVNGIGFSNSDLEAAVKEINKDNVLDVFDNWNASYAPGYINSDKQGLIETIYGEYHFYNGGKEQVSHILNALMEKATEFGDEAIQNVTPLKAQINSELNAWFNTDENKVAESINKIVLILNAYQAQKAAASQPAQTTEQTTQEQTPEQQV